MDSLKESRGSKSSQQSSKTKLYLATYNIRTLQSIKRLEVLEREKQRIKWNIPDLCETRLSGEKCLTLKTGHLLYHNNRNPNSHDGGVALLIHKNIKHLLTTMRTISTRVIYAVLKLPKRYSLQVIQVYVPTNTSPIEEIEQLYEDIPMAKKLKKRTLPL